MSDNKDFITKTVAMLETVLKNVNELQHAFNKMEKRIDVLENGTSVSISQTLDEEYLK